MSGSFRIFRLAGISVYMHWSWFLVAVLAFQFRKNEYRSVVWSVAEYLALFVIVLLHEFGHALACRQVGGQANEIVLWPLGGIAFVKPPPRPGAWLWSIAAGPLVNAVLVPITVGAVFLAGRYGLRATHPDANEFVVVVTKINFGLLVFNLLPIYPLDGGQILQSLLWFVIGRAKSLLVVSVIGLIAGAAAIALAVLQRSLWLGIMAFFIASRCWNGFQQARQLAALADTERREDAACPRCYTRPLVGNFWRCSSCGASFDTFETKGLCPRCWQEFDTTTCPRCSQSSPITEWFAAAHKSADVQWKAKPPADDILERRASEDDSNYNSPSDPRL
ncbi:MAG TPA: M50 family metallopeptidase [Gemmataceae bacterium]|nr:M50 family metallopeptidase [Gemmataceae bacterium]